MFRSCFGATFVEIVATQLAVGFFAFDEMIRNHQDRMLDGHNGLLLATPPGPTPRVARSVATPTRSGASNLDTIIGEGTLTIGGGQAPLILTCD
jgi:hypothetical protein